MVTSFPVPHCQEKDRISFPHTLSSKHLVSDLKNTRDDHKRDLASRLKDDRKVAQTTGQSTGMEGISVGC